MASIPHDKSLESTLALLSEGYQFISNRCQRYQSDVFQTRLMLQPFICLHGAEAACLFYDKDHFERHGAAPGRVKKTLFGQGGVQGLDGEVHRRRKQMFMALMTPEQIGQLAAVTAEQWRAYSQKWETMDQVVLLDEVQMLLCQAVCLWANVPLEAPEVEQRAKELTALIEAPASIGLGYWRGRWARKRTDQWAGALIEKVRAHKLKPVEGSALHCIAWHRNPEGTLLETQVAAVELLNILRPTVAIARFVIFAAVALHSHPECRPRLQAGVDDYDELFVQEVRRFYPFFPFTVAQMRQEFSWKGYHFPQGRKVLLDLYGTNHDPRLWEQPEAFQPERFRSWDKSPFNFIPQGGGDHYQNHRCPGEWITIELMKVSLNFLTHSITYDVPEQDLRISLSKMPALPESRFVISNVRRTG